MTFLTEYALRMSIALAPLFPFFITSKTEYPVKLPLDKEIEQTLGKRCLTET